MRYQFTAADRQRGGTSTASKHDMRQRGRVGFERFAAKYFEGDIQLAGKALSAIGNFVTDPARWNGAWSLPEWFPTDLRQALVERYSRSDDAIPF